MFSEATRQYWAVEITPNSDTLAMNEHKTISVSETLDTPFQFLRNSKKENDQCQRQRNIDYRYCQRESFRCDTTGIMNSRAEFSVHCDALE